MKLSRILVIVVILLAGSRAPATAQDKFRVASGGFSTAIHAVAWAAYEKRLFQKYGLDGEYLALESGTPAMQALLANELQIVFTTGALAITANLQGGDTTIIAGGINFIPNKLLVRPEIKRPEDLKGKRIAISRFGSASDYATQVALEKLGVNPKDVTIVQIGGNLTRFAALMNGTIQATLLSEPLTTMGIRDHKMNSLIDLAESGVPLPQNCFIVRRSYLAANRVKIVNGMKAIIEGYFMVKNDRALGLQLIKKYIRVSDDDANISYDYYLAKHGDGVLVMPERKGLEFILAQLVSTTPKARGQAPES
jgi:NitT/TauT family transport system substrate-binding protein